MLKIARFSLLIIRAYAMDRPVETSIRKKLTEALKPIHLDVINESYMHNVPKEAEMHFKVIVVSKEFEGLPLIQVPTYYNNG